MFVIINKYNGCKHTCATKHLYNNYLIFLKMDDNVT